MKKKNLEMTKAEKIKQLDAEIKAAEEEGDESYLNYIMRIKEMNIHVYDGGVVLFNSGKPNPPY